MFASGISSLARGLLNRENGDAEGRAFSLVDKSDGASSPPEAMRSQALRDGATEEATRGESAAGTVAGLMVAQAVPVAAGGGAAWAAKFAELAFPTLAHSGPASAALGKAGIAAAVGALLGSGADSFLLQLRGINVSRFELQMASMAVATLGLTPEDVATLSEEEQVFFIKSAAVATAEFRRGRLGEADYREALQILFDEAGKLGEVTPESLRSRMAIAEAARSRPNVLADDVSIGFATEEARVFNAQNARGGQIAIPIPRNDGNYTVMHGQPQQLEAAVGALKRAGLLDAGFDPRAAVGQDWAAAQRRVQELTQPLAAVVSESRVHGPPRGLSAGEQRELGLDGRPLDGPLPRNPLMDREGFPTGERGDPRDGIFINPRGSGTRPSDITPSPGPSDDPDLRMDRTEFPLGGESVPVPAGREDAAEGESLTTPPQTLAEVGKRFVANPPLEIAEEAELIAFALGADPDNPDSERMLEVGLAKIGLAGAVGGALEPARRAVRGRLGVESADELMVQITGYVELPNLLREYPEVRDAIITRPKTLEALGQHRLALMELRFILLDLGRQDPLNIRVPELPAPPQSNLTLDQIAISRAASSAIPQEDYLRNQAGFDPAWRNDPEMISQYLNTLYAGAEAALPEFVSLVQDLADTMNGTAQIRPEPKSRQRAMDKIDKYDGDASRLTDLLAGRVVFETIDDIYNALDGLLANENVRLVDFEDRILNPQPSGYRDITMKVELSNGHIAELRFEARSIVQYASEVDHTLYQVYRDIRAHAKRSGAGLTDGAQFILNSIRRVTIPHYNRLFEEANQQQPGGSEPRRNR